LPETGPAGSPIAFDPSARRLDGGRVLLGGSPLRLLTLSETAQRVLADGDWSSRAGTALVAKLLDAGLAHPLPEPGSGPGLEQVSVVIPVHGRAQQVAALVQGLDPKLELIVVDDGSDPPIANATVRHAVARGPAAARNCGIARASRPFVALLDSDVVPPTSWLDRLLPHFADPRVGAVAPRIVAARGSASSPISRLLVRYDAARSPLDLGPRPAPVLPGSRVSYVPAAALVLRRAALGDSCGPAAGPFDERLRYGEDVDLVWRLVTAGWRVRYEPAAAVGHAHRPTLRAAAKQRFGYGYSAAPLAARHPGLLAPFGGAWWTLATWGLIAAGRPVLAAAAVTAAGARLSRKLPVERPLPVAARLAAETVLRSGRALGEALTRPYGPVALPLLLAPGPLHAVRRRVAVAALTLPALDEYRKRHPDLDPVRWLALRSADDLAYGVGLWAGCLRGRSFAALRPRLGATRSTG
jgi:mycofactocin system glycosyltransferase